MDNKEYKKKKKKKRDWSAAQSGNYRYITCLLNYPMLRLTTLWQAAGNNEGLKVKVIDKQDEVGKGKGEDAEGT